MSHTLMFVSVSFLAQLIIFPPIFCLILHRRVVNSIAVVLLNILV